MTISIGVKKAVSYKKEVTFGTIPAATGPFGQAMRRVTSNIELTKATFKSAEIRPDLQVGDFRHGGRSVSGSIAGELSVGTHADFIASGLRQAWQAVATSGALTTVAAAVTTGAQGTLTRSAGSFLTDGFKLGDVVRCTGWTTTATANNAHNFWIISLTATVMTGLFLDGVAMAPKVAGDSVIITQAGRKTWTPATGQTNDSYAIEHYFADIGQSEVFSGCRVSQIDVKLPATGMAGLDVMFMGQNMVPASSQYFTTPLAVTTGSTLAAVNGALILGGQVVGIVTGANIKLNGNATRGDIVGSVFTPDVFMGRVEVDGQLTIYFQDAVARDAFVNETEMGLSIALTANNTANSDFQVFSMPRIKFNGANKSDGEVGLILTAEFRALFNTNGGAGTSTVQTTMTVQDSLA